MDGSTPTLLVSLAAAEMMGAPGGGRAHLVTMAQTHDGHVFRPASDSKFGGGRRDMDAFDVVVLGGGTAGLHVATEAAGGGRSVALVEAGLIGGESPYLACLPSNSLLLSASRGETWEDAVARRNEVTGGLDDSGPARRVADAGVTVIRGTGRITGPGQVEVTLAQGEETVPLTYSDLVIATGCEPVAPPIEGLSDIPAWTTAESLCSRDLPRRLIVLGGGPAGCELTQIYAAFGSQVTLVEAEHALLPGEPAFAGEILAAALRRAGAEIYLGSPAGKAERTPDGLTLALEDGTRIDADRLLIATGRRPRLSGLGLDALGITVTPGMALPTTTTCRVAGGDGGRYGSEGLDGPHRPGRVWAAGDVTGVTQTHASLYQAQVVVANILGRRREADYSAIPRCVFTTPSVFAVGIVPETAQAAKDAEGAEDGKAPEESAAGRMLRTARADLGDTARAYLGQDDLGCLELYADAQTGVLAGAVAVGPDAATWMGEITLAIRAKIPVTILADVVHAFPTYGEAIQTALRELAGAPGTAGTADKQGRGFGSVSELDLETPEDDAIEQRQEVVTDENAGGIRREVPFEVNEADAVEQELAVGFDDDDYR
jgi:pyruvate/2-oxoglutarate dehydrogenase complex dihydrolipoamide dehydrogenase (E3) component